MVSVNPARSVIGLFWTVELLKGPGESGEVNGIRSTVHVCETIVLVPLYLWTGNGYRGRTDWDGFR